MFEKHLKKPSIRDVAREAGVSVKTVSRVLNKEKYVREETKRKVEEAVSHLDYRPNLQARGLASSRSYIVGLFIDELSGDYIMRVQSGILEACEEQGTHLVVETLPDRGDDEKVRDLLSRVNFDGVILTPPVCDDPVVLGVLRDFGVPAFRIGGGREVEDMGSAEVDDYSAARDITDYLIANGHRKIGFVKGDPNHDCSHSREKGFVHALQEAGLVIENDYLFHGNFTYACGVRIGQALLAMEDRPTAMFVSSDIMAAGLAGVLQKGGVTIPGDISLVGFDDDAVCQIMVPYLTTIRQPVSEMAKEATLKVIEACREGVSLNEQALVFDYDLIERDSVQKCVGV